MEFIGYIKDEKYGLLALHIDDINKSIFSHVIKNDNLEIYEELTNSETKELISRLIDDKEDVIL